MKTSLTSFVLLFVLLTASCSTRNNSVNNTIGMEEEANLETTDGVARITEVTVSGEENQYNFNVTIASPDLGCNQYADWWEVIDLDGNLMYRRVLGHSHVNEQPFARSGGPVAISETTQVYIRAHMNTSSYGSQVFKGSVADGFAPDNLDSEFAQALEEVAPLPNGCAF